MKIWPCFRWSDGYRLLLITVFHTILQLLAAPVYADANREARVLFDAGVSASDAERWVEARDYFKRSLALAEKATTLLNMAAAEVKLGLGHDALHTLDVFDRVADPQVHGVQIGRARELRRLAEEAAAADPEGGQKPTMALVTTSPAGPPPQGTRSGEPLASPSARSDSTAAPAKLTSSHLDTARSERGPSLPRPSLRTPRLLLVGGGLLTALSVTGTIAWLRRANDLERCAAETPPCDNAEVVKRERNVGIALSLGAGTAAAGVLTMGALLLGRKKRAGSPRTLAVEWSGTMLTFGAQF